MSTMSCDTCFKEEAHYHIVVEQGKVTEVCDGDGGAHLRLGL